MSNPTPDASDSSGNAVLVPVAFVRSDLRDRSDCPKQYTENAPPARVEVVPEYADAMHTLREGQDVLLLTWLHQADRSYHQVHPRGDASRPKKGVFNTRSPDRPNPLGLHRVRITAINKAGFEVDALEVLDGTPVVDIKSTGPEDRRSGGGDGAENWGHVVGAGAGEELRQGCAAAHALGLLAGVSGNASLRLGHAVVITRSGVSKRRLLPEHVTTLDPVTGEVTGPGKPSTECAMHLAVYREQPEARAVLHTHPPHLLALWMSLSMAPEAKPDGGHELPDLLDLPLFEAQVAAGEMACVAALEPGTRELADAVGAAAREKRAVFMAGHGLMVWGRNLEEALVLSEELDALAKVRLLALSAE